MSTLSLQDPKGMYHWLLVLAVLLAAAVAALLLGVAFGWLPPIDRFDGGAPGVGAALAAGRP